VRILGAVVGGTALDRYAYQYQYQYDAAPPPVH
jgi:hypothetical protein